ncbi:MAG: nucleoside triphosphate pyrophosphohydrolase [Peptostreptococcaceae bacterium]|nr:nucleoside triphosphate pyrophosphohydrolase [Peptostreptococcaceae bacterium]
MKITYNKLTRDNIPQIIEESGRKQTSRIMNEEEYEEALINKVIEEIDEYRISKNEEEIADIYEVLDCLIELKNYEPMHIDYLQLIKREARGSFKKRILLQEVEDDNTKERK